MEDYFRIETSAWREENPDKVLKVKLSRGWKVTNYRDDTSGGPGICVYTRLVTPKGKILAVQTIISKNDLIKALALLIEEEEDA